MKKAFKIIGIVLAIILALFLVVLVVFWINSPGKLPELTDKNGKVIEGSISEKNELVIGGIPQKFFIRSENPHNPVILYLHGGPGSPELPIIMPYETSKRLEKYYTVCYWDQRGAGMSYNSNIDVNTLTVEQFVEDTREMTQYLIERFGENKIYLMGHSWGSFLGIKTIEEYPEYYHAYIGIGQVTHQLLSEQLAYNYMLQYAEEINDHRAVKDLQKFNPESDGFPQIEYLAGARSKYMNKYGIGVMHKDFSMSSLVMDVLGFKGYTMSEKMGYARGNLLSLQHVFYYVIDDNLFESSRQFDIPVYVIHGLYDYQVSYELAKSYLDAIEAPDKAFFTFGNSAHSPNMEEPVRFVETVKRLTNRVDHLNDANQH